MPRTTTEPFRTMGYGKDIITDDGVSPCTYYVTEGVPNTGMMIRKDLLEKAGLDIPVTYEDYDNVMAAFKDRGVKEPFVMDGTSTGCSDVYNAGLEVQLYSHPILGSGNDGFYQVDGQVKFGYLEEGFVTYMTQMADWFQKGYISPDYISENENNNAETFTGKIVAGDVGAVTAGRTNLDTYNTEGKAVNPDFELVAIPSPRKEAGQVIHLGPYRQSSLNSGFYATSACSESDLEALLAWHNYWFTPDGDMLTNYGVEGLTYEMQDGKPVFTDMITNNPDGLTLTQTTYIYIGQMGVVDNSREDQWYSEATVSAKDIWSENVDNAWKIPGACSMTADEANEYSSTFSDIQTYISEMLAKFIMGDDPLKIFLHSRSRSGPWELIPASRIGRASWIDTTQDNPLLNSVVQSFALNHRDKKAGSGLPGSPLLPYKERTRTWKKERSPVRSCQRSRSSPGAERNLKDFSTLPDPEAAIFVTDPCTAGSVRRQRRSILCTRMRRCSRMSFRKRWNAIPMER